MKTAILCSVVASAAAFAPTQQGRPSVAADAFAKGLPGADGPEKILLGKELGWQEYANNWDPLGLSEVRFSCSDCYGLFRVGVFFVS